jgi:hypothetical protein
LRQAYDYWQDQPGNYVGGGRGQVRGRHPDAGVSTAEFSRSVGAEQSSRASRGVVRGAVKRRGLPPDPVAFSELPFPGVRRGGVISSAAKRRPKHRGMAGSGGASAIRGHISPPGGGRLPRDVSPRLVCCGVVARGHQSRPLTGPGCVNTHPDCAHAPGGFGLRCRGRRRRGGVMLPRVADPSVTLRVRESSVRGPSLRGRGTTCTRRWRVLADPGECTEDSPLVLLPVGRSDGRCAVPLKPLPWRRALTPLLHIDINPTLLVS